MRTSPLLASWSVVALLAATAQAQNVPPAYRDQHRHDRGPVVTRPAGDSLSMVRLRADALAGEIDYLQEHLEADLEAGGSAELFAQADDALREAIHFRRSVVNGVDPREVAEHFRTLDAQVHGLMQAVQDSGDPFLERAASRLAFADEQLHAAVSAGGRPTGEFLARQAHVLAGEAQRLMRSAQAVIAQQDRHADGDHHGDPELLAAIQAFTDRVEHFHETAETEDDPGHLAEDFALVDESWHQVVDLLNRNPHGAYFYRRAQRVGAMHDDLSRVIGVKAPRRAIRFNVGGIGINLGR